MRVLKKRKIRDKLKKVLRKSVPKSSNVFKLATNYKNWYVNFVHKSDCFSSTFFRPESIAAKFTKVLSEFMRLMGV